MTPLMFIIIASAVILLLVYWVLSTLHNEDTPDNSRITYFETAPELGTFGYTLSDNSNISIENNEVRLSKLNEMQLVAQWNISQEKWQEKLSEISHPFTEENLTLRVCQTSAGVKSFDIPVKSLQGSHDFFCRPDTAYYVVLGILQTTFIPLIFSNTVIVPPREDSAISH
ncbi:MAG: hypothetical protein ABFC94_14830 [Syntrophomonas sp.]